MDQHLVHRQRGTTGPPAWELVWTKLAPPAPRAGLIARPGRQSLLQASLDAKLCLLGAPAGSGKTTLLAQWCATAGTVRLALGRALTRQGGLTQAETQLAWALELFGIDGMAVHRAHALLLLAAVRHGQGDLPGARGQLRRAGELIGRLADPGMLAERLERARLPMGSTSRRRAAAAGPLTERELTGPSAAAHPAHDPGDRPGAPRLSQHGPDPGPGHLPEARCHHPGRGGRPPPPARPADFT
jgi:ATP/maltotriose-dependent transcriptional regulator MalT